MKMMFLILLLGATVCLVSGGGSAWLAPRRINPRRRSPRRASPAEPESLPRIVQQIASLLSAGGTGSVAWTALAQVLTVEQRRARSTQTEATLLLVLSVERGSILGLPTAAALRSSCAALSGKTRPNLTPEQQRMWLDVAACFDVCEASGAPVAEVLERLARTIESEQDAAALRETALAGPKATVRLLNWLPLIGLGLGMAMGVNPFSVLLGSALGWGVMAVGIGLSLAGRAWSDRLILAAAETAPRAAFTRGRDAGTLPKRTG